jgi:hypothetical protein
MEESDGLVSRPDCRCPLGLWDVARRGAGEKQRQTQTEKTSKPKKSKKSTADATASQGATALDEVNGAASKAKKPKASSVDATSSHSADRAVAGDKPSFAAVEHPSNEEIQAAKASGQVWVNTSSGVFHKNGKWFGATREGKFMTEQDAIKARVQVCKNREVAPALELTDPQTVTPISPRQAAKNRSRQKPEASALTRTDKGACQGWVRIENPNGGENPMADSMFGSLLLLPGSLTIGKARLQAPAQRRDAGPKSSPPCHGAGSTARRPRQAACPGVWRCCRGNIRVLIGACASRPGVGERRRIGFTNSRREVRRHIEWLGSRTGRLHLARLGGESARRNTHNTIVTSRNRRVHKFTY